MNPQAYSLERLRKALLQFSGGRAAQAAARAVLVLLLVRILSVPDFGAYMLIVGTAELLLPVASFGLLPLAQRYLPQLLTTVPVRKLYVLVACLVLAQAAVLSLIALALGLYWTSIAPVFGMTEAQTTSTHFAAWLFLIVPAFRFGTELLETMLAQGQIARAVMVFMRAVAVVLLALFKPEVGLADVLLVDMVATGLCLVLVWLSLQRNLKSLHTPTATGILPLREMLRFASHMAPVGPMSATANPGAIRLVLANTLGLAESGLYAFLQSLERMVSRYLPATLLRNMIRPMLISRVLGKGGEELLQVSTGLLLKSNMLAVTGGLVVIAVCGDEIVKILSGGKFVGAGLTLLLLYLNMIATSQRGVQEMVMQITGHTRALSITAMISPLALLAVWLFAGHGLNVAVLIVTAGSMTANWLAAGVLRASTDWFRIDWRGTAAILLPGLAAAATGIAVSHYVWPILGGVLALLLFVVFLRIGRPFNVREIGAVERVVGKRAVRLLRGFAV